MRPRLCYVLPRYDESTDTHYRYLYEMLDDLARDVDLYVVIEKAWGPVTRTWPKVRVIRSTSAPLRALELAGVLARARLDGYDRFYTDYSYYAGILCGAIAAATGARSYYWSCGLVGKYLSAWGSPGALRKKLRNDWPLWLSVRLATRLVTGTPRMIDHYAAHFGLPRTRAVVAPNWVEEPPWVPSRVEARAALGVPQDAPVALFVHHLSPRKGANRLPALAWALAGRVPGLVCLVAGDGPEREAIEAAKAPLTLLGRVPNRDISRLYAAADVFLMPSEEEGFPRVLLEAMVHRVPFVATDVGGVRDVVPDSIAASVVPDGDMTAFVDRAVERFRDPALREAHARAWDQVRGRFSRAAAIAAWRAAVLE